MIADSPIVQLANAQALGAAGAFTTFAFDVTNATECSFWVTYTQGAAGGQPTVRVQWFPLGAGNTPTTPGDHIGVVISAGLNLVAEEWVLVNPGSSPYRRVLHLKVPPATVLADFAVAESGVVGTPGTVSIWAGTRGGV